MLHALVCVQQDATLHVVAAPDVLDAVVLEVALLDLILVVVVGAGRLAHLVQHVKELVADLVTDV